jgi:flagellar motor switch protein FliM
MAEQILSQEEVGALLSAMDKGEVNLEKDKHLEPVAEPYDLTAQSIILRDQFAALDEIYDKLKTLLNSSLSSFLQKEIKLELVSSEIVKFGEFIKAFSHPTSFNGFTMEPLTGTALLTIEPKLVFSLIDCMLGGDGKPLETVREFTLIEQRMIGKFANDLLGNLEQAWKGIHSVKCSLKSAETRPDFVRIFSPNDALSLVVFNLDGGEFSGKIYLCISCLMLEPIRDKLSSTYSGDSELESSWSAQIQELLKLTRLNVTAELGKTTAHTVRDLLSFQCGDVIKLDTGPQDTMTIAVELIPKYLGFPGVSKGNRAVQVSGLFRQDGGVNDHG